MQELSLTVGTWNCNAGCTPAGQDFGFRLDTLEDRVAGLDLLLMQEAPVIGGKLDARLGELLSNSGLIHTTWHALARAHNREAGVQAALLIAARAPLRDRSVSILANPRLTTWVDGARWESHDKGILSAVATLADARVSVSSVHLLPHRNFGLTPQDPAAVSEWSELSRVVRHVGGRSAVKIVAGDFNRDEHDLVGLTGLASGRPTRPTGESHDNIFVHPPPSQRDVEILVSPSDHHFIEASLRYEEIP